jgi:hypothetical protein
MNEELIVERIDNLTKIVIAHCEKQDDWAESHHKEHTNIWIELSILKTKSGVWGMLGGAIVVIVSILIAYLKGVK